MKKVSKKSAVYGVIVLLLVSAIYLNRTMGGEPPEELLASGQTGLSSTEVAAEGGEEQNYFATSRLTREKARDEAVSTLREVSDSETADAAARESAGAQIAVLAARSVSEANAESMIRAKGFADAVVMIGEGSVNVVVAPPEGGLAAADVTIIRDVVLAETGVSAAQIKVTEAL